MLPVLGSLPPKVVVAAVRVVVATAVVVGRPQVPLEAETETAVAKAAVLAAVVPRQAAAEAAPTVIGRAP